MLLGEPGTPYLVKIACNGDSAVGVGKRIDNGTMISVGNQLWLFVPEGSGPTAPTSTFQREISLVSNCYWGGQTSCVVALFMNGKDAMACYRESNHVWCDPRWKNNSIEVLRAIGENHPHCSITNYPDLILIPKQDWFQKVD